MNNARSKRKNIVFKITTTAVFAALSFVCTAFLPIPIASGQGYINFSDAFIFLVASLISPIIGGCVGALSGSMSDLVAGYGSFAPYTAVIKFVEGIVAGYLFILLKKILKGEKTKYISFVSFFIGGLIMAFLYMIPDFVMYTKEVAFIDLPFNILQGAINAIVAIICFVPLSRIPPLNEKGFKNTTELKK